MSKILITEAKVSEKLFQLVLDDQTGKNSGFKNFIIDFVDKLLVFVGS